MVFENHNNMAFLDKHPVFLGHTLLIPKKHIETFYDLPEKSVPDYFNDLQLLGKAIENALVANGTFIAINNRISQSVPHLHTHIIPRRKGDGLRGFFWPRQKYEHEDHIREIQGRIIEVLQNSTSF